MKISPAILAAAAVAGVAALAGSARADASASSSAGPKFGSSSSSDGPIPGTRIDASTGRLVWAHNGAYLPNFNRGSSLFGKQFVSAEEAAGVVTYLAWDPESQSLSTISKPSSAMVGELRRQKIRAKNAAKSAAGKVAIGGIKAAAGKGGGLGSRLKAFFSGAGRTVAALATGGASEGVASLVQALRRQDSEDATAAGDVDTTEAPDGAPAYGSLGTSIARAASRAGSE